MRLGIGTRLIALVTLPLVALGVTAWSLVGAQRDAAANAAAVGRGLEEVEALIVARSGLFRERAGVEARTRVAGLGLSEAVAVELLGKDVIGQRIEGALVLDNQVQISPAVRATVDAEALAHARALSRDPTTPASALVDAYRDADHAFERAIDERLFGLRAFSAAVDASLDLDQRIAVVRALADIEDYAFEQVSGLSDHWFNRSEDRYSQLVHLAETTALLDRRVTEATSWARGDTAVNLAEVLQSSSAVTFRFALDAAILHPDDRPDMASLQNVYTAGVDRSYRFDRVLVAAAESTALQAELLRADAETEFERRLTLALLAAVVIASATVVVASGIRRPLRSLAAQADRLRSGDIDVITTPAGGLPEVHAASRAMADLSHNLLLVEAQGRALAACDLDDDSLHRSVPGRLGDTLRSTFATLSASIVERERLQQRLEYQASHDALTRLTNRAAAIVRMRDLSDSRTPGAKPLAVMYIDLDDFKVANDTFGHAAGDHILQAVAARLQREVRADDVVARLGGDEFMVVAGAVDDVNDARSIARRLVEAVARPIPYGSDTLRVRACIGVALVHTAHAADDALLHADVAVYQAKRIGPGSVVVFDDELRAAVADREEVEAALRDSLHAGGEGLRVEYQPLHFLDGRPTLHFEALLRWERPGVGPVSPARFIPVAEAGSLIVDIDRWVLRTVIAQIATWLALDRALDIQVSVNVSGKHLLGHSLTSTVRDLLDEMGVPPSCLVLEVTETVLLNDMDTASRQLGELRDLGVRVAIDDFGTGYTSIAHIRRLPIDAIKIDGSFIRRLDDERERSLVQMLIDLGHHLGLEVVAECVETEDQLRTLQSLGCDAAQGFYFSPSIAAADVPAWVVVAG